MVLRFISLLLLMGLAQFSFALAGYISIETHMEPQGQSERKPYSERCREGEPDCNQDYVGARILSPTYPTKMLKKHQTAVCVADISLNTLGEVAKVNEVICKPNKSHFLISVREVIKQYIFEPRLVNGKAVPVKQALLKFNYEIK